MPVVLIAMVGLPDTPLPLPMETPGPAVRVLPETPPDPSRATMPVAVVKSAVAFKADMFAVNATQPIFNVPVTFRVSELSCIGA